MILQQYQSKMIKKIAYVGFIGALTASALSACYWQTQRYQQAKKRWKIIQQELSREHPDQLQTLKDQQLFAYKYVSIRGQLESGLERVDRMRNGRMGYLLIRPLSFNKNEQKQQVVAVQGWCDSSFEFTPSKPQLKEFKGILRSKQKKDYVNQNFKPQDLQKYKMSTYIDLQALGSKLSIKPSYLSQNYYVQILKPLQSSDQQTFPYQYSVDNFQLPYLTPDKHLSYATFWGCSSLVGIFAIFKALALK